MKNLNKHEYVCIYIRFCADRLKVVAHLSIMTMHNASVSVHCVFMGLILDHAQCECKRTLCTLMGLIRKIQLEGKASKMNIYTDIFNILAICSVNQTIHV